MPERIFGPVADWMIVIGTVTGVIGGATGIVALILGQKLGSRNLFAAERAAKAAEDAAAAGDLSAQSSERSARAAELAVREAQTLSSIETGRRHDELGPGKLDVSFVWRPGAAIGGVWAEVINHKPHDLEVFPMLTSEGGGETDLGYRVLRAGVMTKFFVEHLSVPEIKVLPAEFDDQRDLLRQTDNAGAAVRKAFRQARARFSRLEMRYRRVNDPCPCTRQPSSDTYGHWVTHHDISDLSL